MTVFNEWHNANTSKKLRAVFEANAKAGKYKTTVPPYRYLKGTDSKHTPVIEPTGAAVVRRILNNPIYLGRLSQLRTKTVSYKNHKVIIKDESDRVVIENNHEPIISQELWDRVQEVNASVSRGRCTTERVTHSLSWLCYCDECGAKMKMQKTPYNKNPYSYRCGMHVRYGKGYCSSHNIKGTILDGAILQDIKRQIDLVLNEPDIREKLLAYKKGDKTERDNSAKKRLLDIDNRIKELDRLIRSVYEDKVAGLIPDKVCAGLLGEYQEEKDNLTAEYEELRKRTDAEDQDERDVDEYIRRLKSYAGVDTLTRQMAMDLLEYVTVDRYEGKYRKIANFKVGFLFEASACPLVTGIPLPAGFNS